MRKYMEVAKITFKSQLAYSFDVILRVILSFARIFLAFILWSAVFKERGEIAGFSFSMMITYYIITSYLRRLDQSDSIVGQLGGEIREGHFTKYLVKPVKPLWYFIFLSYSKTAFMFGINIAATLAAALIFRSYFIMPLTGASILGAAALNLLGLNFMILLNYFVAILSFRFVDIWAFNMIKNHIIDFLNGTLLPLALLPAAMQGIMKLFPFYHIFYLPAMVYMGYRTNELPAAFIILAVWNVIMLVVNIVTYKSLKSSYEGVGI